MHSLIHGQAHSATTRGHTLGNPRLYDLFANIFFLGTRRATFQALITAAGVEPGQRVLVIHHLPADLQVVALQEIRRVNRAGAKLLIGEAQTRAMVSVGG
jgi:ubiquinone/menaquinone biosynthesis C-methylase UbiE